MPLCSVIAYTFPSTAWSYVLYILQLDKMVWLKNEVAALIAVFICYKVVTWTPRVTLIPASQSGWKGEKVERNKVPPYLWLYIPAAEGAYVGISLGGQNWPSLLLAAGHAPPCSSLSLPAGSRAYERKARANKRVENLLSEALICGRHDMMINVSETQNLPVTSFQEKDGMQILGSGNGRKEPKKRGVPGGKGEAVLGRHRESTLQTKAGHVSV